MEYSFEKKKFTDTDELAYNGKALLNNLNLTGKDLNDYEPDLIRTFCKTNIRNIAWYKKRIKTENTYRKAYGFITTVLLVGVPILVFYLTLYQSQLISGRASIEKENTFNMEIVGSLITVLPTSVLALHKLVSSWIEKRKFRSLFHQAKFDLMNILFALVDEHGRYTGDNQNYATSVGDGVLSDDLVEDLQRGIKESRVIVAKETKTYFEMSATPAFDLAGTLANSATSAKSLFTSFKSKTWKLDALKKEQREQETQEKAVQDDIAKKSISLRSRLFKLERLANAEGRVCSKLDPLEKITEADRTVIEQTAYDALEAEYEQIQLDIEELEFECFELQARLEYAQRKAT